MKKYELHKWVEGEWKTMGSVTHPNPYCTFALTTEYFKREMRKQKIKYSFANRTHRVVEVVEDGYREDPNALMGTLSDYESPNQMFRRSMNQLDRLGAK